MPSFLAKLFGGGKPKRPPPDREFPSSLAGVSRKNPDGTKRQAVISEDLHAGSLLVMRPEDDNPVDKNAVAVFSPAGRQVGYLDARLAAETRRYVARGGTVEANVTEVTGGTKDKPTRGVNVQIRVWEGE